MNKKFTNLTEAQSLIGSLSQEFAFVKNPDYIHPEYELYPLAPKLDRVKNLSAVVMDMDGTTTTTEELCIHSLGFMIRKMSGMDHHDWKGLDHAKDYPHIIGNSTTKHVEYLIQSYKEYFNRDSIIDSYLYAALWGLIYGKDSKRKEEVLSNLKSFGLASDVYDLISGQEISTSAVTLNNEINQKLKKQAAEKINEFSFSDLVRIGIDIYYQRYHEILLKIRNGEGAAVSQEILNNQAKHLIEPMPGILMFLTLIKGWIKEKDEKFIEEFTGQYCPGSEVKANQLKNTAAEFRQAPAKTAIVTSSIFYEADIVMNEVFKIFREQIGDSSFSEESKKYLQEKFSDYNNVYDAFVTASDSSEIRLKPHRDLYSIALHRLNVPKNKFSEVIGLEDSESGTIAIRAAGIGLCIAVPFVQTSGHNLNAAAHVCLKGVPEVLTSHNLFLAE